MGNSLHVAVVGGGTAGLASATLLRRAGHRVTVFERVPQPGPVGAGILTQPSGLAVLERLGVVDTILSRGARVSRLACETWRGRPVLDLSYESLAPGLFGVGLHRGVLFETLVEAAQRAGAEVQCGVEIVRVDVAGDRAAVVSEAGRRYEGFDLVVVSDGARSRVRDAMTELPHRVRPYPWGALWFIARDPGQRHRDQLHQFVRGTRQMVGLLPTGLGPGHGEVPLVSLFASTRVDAVEVSRSRGLEAWKAGVREVAPASAEVLDQIHDMDQLTFATYHDVVMPRWHGHRVVILGDAAHATSPQLGQGCNLALCDAAALADALESEATLEAALARYSASRRNHLAFYQLATRWLTPFFQSGWESLGVLRDVLMGPFSQIGFFRREMIRSMAGTKAGLLWGALPMRMPQALAPARG